MFADTLMQAALLVAALALVVVIVLPFAVPSTKPLLGKFRWYAVIALVAIVAIFVFRKDPRTLLLRSKVKKAKADGQDIVDESDDAFSKIIGNAEEQILLIEADTKREREMAQGDSFEYQAKLDTVKGIQDDRERRLALIRLVDGAA